MGLPTFSLTRDVSVILAIGISIAMVILSIAIPLGYYTCYSHRLFVEGGYEEQVDGTSGKILWVRKSINNRPLEPVIVENLQ